LLPHRADPAMRGQRYGVGLSELKTQKWQQAAALQSRSRVWSAILAVVVTFLGVAGLLPAISTA
jgi:hypothetical protein